MKKMITLVTILILVMVPLSIHTSASEPVQEIQLAQNQEITYYEDGSYAISTLTEDDSAMGAGGFTVMAAASTKTGSKSTHYYSSDHILQWTVKTTGTFSYNGSTSSCTSSSVSYTIYDSSWKVKSAVASKSGATAIGDFTIKYYALLIPIQTQNVRVTVYCSPSGALS